MKQKPQINPVMQNARERLWETVVELGRDGMFPPDILIALGQTIVHLSQSMVDSGGITAENMRKVLTELPLAESFDADVFGVGGPQAGEARH